VTSVESNPAVETELSQTAPELVISAAPAQPTKGKGKQKVKVLPKAKIVKINIDENPSTPSKYGVRGIPTLMVFKGGQVAATKVGAAPKNQLQSWIEQSI